MKRQKAEAVALIQAAPTPVSKTADDLPPGPWFVWQSLDDNSINVSSAATKEFICLVGRVAEGDYDADRVRRIAEAIASLPTLIGQRDDIPHTGDK